METLRALLLCSEEGARTERMLSVVKRRIKVYCRNVETANVQKQEKVRLQGQGTGQKPDRFY